MTTVNKKRGFDGMSAYYSRTGSRESLEGWNVVQKREAYAGQFGTYNELGYNWKF